MGIENKNLDNSDTLKKSFRPNNFNEFIGQKKVKERLKLMITASLERKETIGHTLLSGPPGLGKTTLANIIATSMGSNLHITSGPQIEKAGDLVGILTNLKENDILFIDEIHRLHPSVEEYLYPAIEDFKLDIIIDQGPNARSIQLKLPSFTLIGATTRSGLLTAPLRSRFIINSRLEYYQNDELSKIITQNSQKLKIKIDSHGATEIAKRARGTPRIANSLLMWTRDYAQVKANNKINETVAASALQMLDIDKDGLDEMDKSILEALLIKFNGGPVGINSLAIAVSEDIATIEDVHEPYLIMQGYIQRTPRGRLAMPKAYQKMGIEAPKYTQNKMF